jgi:hypothetical protein
MSKNPFAGQLPGRPNVQAIDAASRIHMVASFSIEECEAAMQMTNKLQISVLHAVERQLRKLRKAAKSA